ncbi:MAG: hypothetical protein MJB14_13260, partial [Spirochaetes bacterium]|nr:hypothetical protein [Spirochaetota bacterium]
MKKKILFWFIILCSFYHLPAFDYVPLQGQMKEIKTANFRIIYPAKYTEKGKITAVYAEDIYAKLSPFFQWNPKQRIILVLTDHTDAPNGLASTFPRNSIYLYLADSDFEKTFRDFADPYYTMLVHELAHILQIDQIRGGVWFWRVLYGRLYFPLVNAFKWYHEGSAVLAESLFSPDGRLQGSYNRAIVQAFAKDKKIPDFSKIVDPVVEWPQGNQIYHIGAAFLEYLYQQYGQEKFQQFIIDQSNDFWPFVFQFVLKFKKIYGKSLQDLWNEWKAYEEAALDTQAFSAPPGRQITHLQGEILDLDFQHNKLLVSSYSYENDNALYLYDLSSGDFKKIKKGSYYSINLTHDQQYILATKMTASPGGFYYYDLYCYDLKKKQEKQLTFLERISFVAVSDHNQCVLVKNNAEKSELELASFNQGKITKRSKLPLNQDFQFIGKP